MKPRYKDQSVAELRRLCASRKIGTGVWRAGARQNELVRSLLDSDSGKPWHGAAPKLPEQPQPPAAPAMPEPSIGASTELGAVLAAAIQPHISTKVDKQEVIDLITEHSSESLDTEALTELCVSIIKEHTAPTELVITDVDESKVAKLPRQHYKFELLLKCAQAALPVYLVGPAGSGKTTVSHSAAEALGLEFEAVSFGPQTSKADLFGYRDANGIYHDTALVRSAQKGKLFLGDEMDAGNAGVTTGCNMALANGHLAIPTGMLEKHEDFRFIGAGNTFGVGANRQYVGRNPQDAATLDRFCFIEWPYDEGLEAASVGISRPSPKLDIAEGGMLTTEQWLDYVQRVRRAVDKLGVRMIVSPRATQYGAKLIPLGVGRKHLEEMLIWKGCDQATKDKVIAAL